MTRLLGHFESYHKMSVLFFSVLCLVSYLLLELRVQYLVVDRAVDAPRVLHALLDHLLVDARLLHHTRDARTVRELARHTLVDTQTQRDELAQTTYKDPWGIDLCFCLCVSM